MRRPLWLQEAAGRRGLPATGSSDELRYALGDLGSALRHLVLAKLDRVRLQRRLTATHAPRRISLGAGPSVPEGWLGLDLKNRSADIFFADLRRPLPLPDDAIDALLAEHVLEHLFLDDVARLLQECARVLKPGGVIRIVSPDAEFLARALLEPDAPEVAEQVAYDRRLHRRPPNEPGGHWRFADRLAHQWGSHCSILAPGLIAIELTAAGFVDVTRCGLEESYFFDQPPGTHLDRFPGPQHDAFALEAAVPTPEPPRSPSSDARRSAPGEPLAGRVVRVRR